MQDFGTYTGMAFQIKEKDDLFDYLSKILLENQLELTLKNKNDFAAYSHLKTANEMDEITISILLKGYNNDQKRVKRADKFVKKSWWIGLCNWCDEKIFSKKQNIFKFPDSDETFS